MGNLIGYLRKRPWGLYEIGIKLASYFISLFSFSLNSWRNKRNTFLLAVIWKRSPLSKTFQLRQSSRQSLKGKEAQPKSNGLASISRHIFWRPFFIWKIWPAVSSPVQICSAIQSLDLLSYGSKTTEKWEQYDWRTERKFGRAIGVFFSRRSFCSSAAKRIVFRGSHRRRRRNHHLMISSPSTLGYAAAAWKYRASTLHFLSFAPLFLCRHFFTATLNYCYD